LSNIHTGKYSIQPNLLSQNNINQFSAAVRSKQAEIQAVPVDIVENSPMYNYNVYLLPMGKRAKGRFFYILLKILRNIKVYNL